MRGVLAAAIVATFGLGARPVPTPAVRLPFIAHRYDDARVVFSLEKTVPYGSEMKQRTLAQNPTRLPDPAAKLSGMTLWAMNAEFWKRHASEVSGTSLGERWELEVGGRASLHCTVERLAMAEVECGTTVAAIARVDPADQPAFKALGEMYYLVVPEASQTAVPAPEPAILKDPPALSLDAKERLEAVLEQQLQNELAKVRRTSGASYDLMARLGRTHSWEERDERLARGEGSLFYDLRACRLTPDGQARYYVRARWALDKETAFLMSVWVWPQHDMLVESVYSRPSEWMRMNEFQSERLGFNDLGTLLNVFDYDGDGWGEVLLAQRREAGFRMHLLEYSDRRGLQRTGVVYRYGC